MHQQEEEDGWEFGSGDADSQAIIADAVHSQQLDLSSRQLEHVPLSVFACAGLQILNLSSNALSALPDEIGQLAALRVLDVSFNKLSELPHSIGDLHLLELLNLAYNQLEKLCPAIGSLDNLQHLHLNDNALRTLPAALGGLQHLSELRVQYNQLALLPPSLGRLTALTLLEVEGNPLPPYILSAGLQSSMDVERLRAVLGAQPGAASARPGSSGAPVPTRPPTSGGTVFRPPSAAGSAGSGSSAGRQTAGTSEANRPASSSGRRFKVDMLVLDEVRVQSRLSPKSPKLMDGPADEAGDSSDDMADDLFIDSQAVGGDSEGPSSRPLLSPSFADSAAATSSAVDIAESEALKDISDLPPAAAAVLYRSWDSLRVGVSELSEGRPITRGGSAEIGRVHSSLLGGGGGVATGTQSGPGNRPSTGLNPDRPYTASRSMRPGSATSPAPRPGTASCRPSTALSRPGTASSQSSFLGRPRTASGVNTTSAPSLAADGTPLPAWMPKPAGIAELIASSASSLSPCAAPGPGSPGQQRPSTSAGARQGPEAGPSQQTAAGPAAAWGGSGFEGLPPITFPLTSGVRAMLRQLSAGGGAGKGVLPPRPASRGSAGEAGGPGGGLPPRPGSRGSDTPLDKSGTCDPLQEVQQSGTTMEQDGEGAQNDLVRQLLMSRNPQLLSSFNNMVDGGSEADEGGEEDEGS